MRSGVEPACYRVGVAGRVVSFMLTCLAFWCFLFISSFAYSLISSNAVYAACSAAMTIDGNVSLNVRANDGNITTDIVTVDTDCINGYTLSISAPTDSNLYLNGDSSGSATHISPTLGTKDSPTSIIGEGKYNTWGISMDNGTTVSSNTFFSIPSERIDIYRKDSPSETGGDDITIYYGASASYDLKAGTYTMANGGEITYYLVAHPGTTVYFDANGGTTPSFESKEVTPGQPYGELPTTSRDGYTFLGWNRLPSEYQEVEYVRFNNYSFIDTGLTPTNHTTEIKFDFETYASDEFLLGTSLGSSYYYFSSYDRKYAFGHDGSKSYTTAGTWTTGDHTLIYNGENNSVILDDTTLESGYGIAANANLWIGKRNSSANFSGKIYYAKITDKSTGKLVRDMVPCYNRNTYQIGFYDLINDQFYGDSGSGELGKGNDVGEITPLTEVISSNNHTLYAKWGHNPTVTFDANGGIVSPASKTLPYDSVYGELPTPTRTGYTFLGWSKNDYVIPEEYQMTDNIVLNGSEYIDTNYALWKDKNWKMELRFEVSQFYDYDNMFGSLDKTDTNNEIWINSGGNYYIRVGGVSKTSIYKLSLNTPYTIIHDNTGNRLLNYVDGTLTQNLNRANTSFSSTLGFGHRASSYYLKGKVYYLKFWSNGMLVRNFIPVYNKTTDEAGLYDTTDGVFYSNQGSGAFGKGVDIVQETITPSTHVVTNDDHTTHAIWEKDS